METAKLQRINELAHKAKTAALTPEELAERDILRKEYIAEWRAGVKAQLDNTMVVAPDGSRRPLKNPKTDAAAR